MTFSGIEHLQKQLADGTTTCVEVVQYYLQQIEQTKSLNAWVEVFGEEALARATDLDKKRQAQPNQLGKLFGVVISLKDNICFEGHRVSAAAKILENYRAIYSATAVERLLAADAIILGRTNCDQFGMGSSNENSIYGAVKNAADTDRIPGGSSGGAAVSVQSDTCLAAIGSDTGGSVRQPAAFCGLFGLKPTYGRISRHGLLAYGSSFDQIGTITRNAKDAALLLSVMAGDDAYDSTALPGVVPEFAEDFHFRGKAKVAYFSKTIHAEGLDPAIRTQTLSFLQKIEQHGHTVSAVEFDLMDFVIPCYYVLTTAEASSNLSRYDGVRYGYRHPAAKNLLETYLFSRSEGFSEEVKRRILLGTFVLSSGYYDAYYNKAQRVRRLLQNRILEIFQTFDFIVLPAAPSVAWKFGEKNNDPLAMYLSDIFTVLANLVGIPAIALPIGADAATQMPIGVQLMANLSDEKRLLTFAESLSML